MNETTQNILKLQESLSYIQNKFGFKAPDMALVLGSGLGDVVHEFLIEKTIPYSEIPHFPKGHVQGHTGELLIGTMHDKRVLIFSGRFHSYQGYANSIAATPAWIAGFWKIPTLIVTNASGGILPKFKPGDISLIQDHIFLQSDHPLKGVMLPNWDNPFCDMTFVYDDQLRKNFVKAATKAKVKIHQGVYLCLDGPTYESPTEVKMYKNMGAHMVGMSTVPEVIVARKMGMKVLGVSMIANSAAGVGKKVKITHEDVVESVQKAQSTLSKIFRHFFHL